MTMWSDSARVRSTPTALLLESKRIAPPEGIGGINKDVVATSQPNRILMHEPPYARIEVSKTVVVQAGFLIILLPLKAEGLLCQRGKGMNLR